MSQAAIRSCRGSLSHRISASISNRRSLQPSSSYLFQKLHPQNSCGLLSSSLSGRFSLQRLAHSSKRSDKPILASIAIAHVEKAMESSLELSNGRLVVGSKTLLSDVAPNVRLSPASTSSGAFIGVSAKEASSAHTFELGTLT
jgi:hypothetical protein